MNANVKDIESINSVPRGKWLEHRILWQDIQREDLIDIGDVDENVDLITMP